MNENAKWIVSIIGICAALAIMFYLVSVGIIHPYQY